MLRRARVMGLRSSWLMASSSARLASSICWMSRPMVLMVAASWPSSSGRRGCRTAMGWLKSPAPKRRAPSPMASSGRSRWRAYSQASSVSPSSADSA